MTLSTGAFSFKIFCECLYFVLKFSFMFLNSEHSQNLKHFHACLMAYHIYCVLTCRELIGNAHEFISLVYIFNNIFVALEEHLTEPWSIKCSKSSSSLTKLTLKSCCILLLLMLKLLTLFC